MTLHEAIIEVLVSSHNPLSSTQIADEVNERGLYRRKDGQNVSATQISARAANYPHLLEVADNGQIKIINRALHSYRISFTHLLNLLRNSKVSYPDAILLSAGAIYFAWAGIQLNFSTNNFYKHDFVVALNKAINDYKHQSAFSRFLELFDKITDEEAFRIYEIMCVRPYDNPSAEIFGEFFNDIINEYTSTSNLFAGEHSTPRVISKFIGSIYDVESRGKIFDPFVGYGGSLIQSYMHNRDKHPVVVGSDINFSALQIATLNYLANGGDKTYFYHKNAFTGWRESIGASLFITVPPFGMKVPVREMDVPDQGLFYSLGLGQSNGTIDASVATVYLALAHLHNEGKAVIVVPDGLLFSGKYEFNAVRRYLIETGFLAGLISLPAGSFRPFASVSCSVLLIDKERFKRRNIFVCDASQYNIDAFGKDYNRIIESFHTSNINIDSARFVEYSEVVDADYLLVPKRFLAEPLTGNDYISIRHLSSYIGTGTVVPKSNINRESGLPFFQVGDLIDSDGINELDISKAEYFISDKELLPQNPNFIQDRSVLITKIGTKLKPALYTRRGDALCNPNIIVIKPDEGQLLPEYLITQLQSDYVLNQIELIRHNVGVPHFSKADFLNVKIKVISLEEQRKFVASFYGRRLKEEAQISERRKEEGLYSIISTLKHELKQPVSSLGMDIKTLKEFLSNRISGGLTIGWDDPVVELLPGQDPTDLRDFQLLKVIERLEACVNNAQNTLTKAEETLNVGAGVFTPEKVLIKNFIVTSILPAYINEYCIINVLGNDIELYVDKYQIGLLFRRLIENAIKHGFRNRANKTANTINIKIVGHTPSREFVEIVIENNGVELPEGFDKTKFETRGLTTNRTTGSGFGGYQIKQIIENHKGEFYIADTTETGLSEFKVKFKIYLPWQQ